MSSLDKFSDLLRYHDDLFDAIEKHEIGLGETETERSMSYQPAPPSTPPPNHQPRTVKAASWCCEYCARSNEFECPTCQGCGARP